MDKGLFKESLSISFIEKNATILKKVNLESSDERLDLKFKDIIDLEADIYPESMRSLPEIIEPFNADELDLLVEQYDYLEKDLDLDIDSVSADEILVTGSKNKWYLILEKNEDCVEIVDMAAKDGVLPIFKILNFFEKLKESGIKKIKMDARESTSYPLIKALIKRKKAVFKEKKPWTWGEEKMYPITIYL
jgi:hypothetical protein